MSTLPSLPVSIDPSKCTNCGRCLDACPTGVFERNEDGDRVLVRYPRDCHTCFLCVPDCPERAIAVSWDAPNPRHRSVYDVLAIGLPDFPRTEDEDAAQ